MSDLISRQDAIDAWWHDEVFFGNQRDDMTKEQWLDYITDIIGSLPSADRPTGEWVMKDGELVCSECGNSVSFSRAKDGWILGLFCQTCGAKMGGDDE